MRIFLFFVIAVLVSGCPAWNSQPKKTEEYQVLEDKSLVIAEFFHGIVPKLTDDVNRRVFLSMLYYFVESDRKAITSLLKFGIELPKSRIVVTSDSCGKTDEQKENSVPDTDTESMAQKSRGGSDRPFQNLDNERKEQIISDFFESYINTLNKFNRGNNDQFLDKNRTVFADFIFWLFLDPRVKEKLDKATSTQSDGCARVTEIREVEASVEAVGEGDDCGVDDVVNSNRKESGMRNYTIIIVSEEKPQHEDTKSSEDESSRYAAFLNKENFSKGNTLTIINGTQVQGDGYKSGNMIGTIKDLEPPLMKRPPL